MITVDCCSSCCLGGSFYCLRCLRLSRVDDDEEDGDDGDSFGVLVPVPSGVYARFGLSPPCIVKGWVVVSLRGSFLAGGGCA